MKYTSNYFVQGNGEPFYLGDKVHIQTIDGGGQSGLISHITCKSIYLHVGNKRDRSIPLREINEIRRKY